MSQINSVEKLLGRPVPAGWEREWGDSEFYKPNGWGSPPAESIWEELARQIKPDPRRQSAIVRASRILKDIPSAWRLFRHCHFLLFGGEQPCERSVACAWPRLPEAAHPGASLFHALTLVAGVPVVLKRNRRRGIRDSTTLETLHDLDRWILPEKNSPGGWGFSNISWMYGHFAGELFSLGRLQFQFDPLTQPVKVFRNKESGDLCLLAPGGAPVRSDFIYANEKRSKPGSAAVSGRGGGAQGDRSAFTTVYEETDLRAIGHPLTEAGRISPEPRVLDKKLWAKVRETGDPALSVHIPAGAPLDPEACAWSFRRAESFFKEHFPERSPRVFFTNTWLLDPEIAGIVPAGSNIARFQEFFHRVPLLNTDDAQMWERVFDSPGGAPDPSSVSVGPLSSLQRAILAHLARGATFRKGGGLRLI